MEIRAPSRAMVLAAGLGTRLRPLTDRCPKALVQLDGRTLLEITLGRLRRLGICEVIVNVHHCADQLEDYLRAQQNFGMRIEISREEELLDTGGGLLKAADFFLRDSAGEPFLLHNVDVISDIDLAEMVNLHCREGALATLAVQQRQSSRSLLLDDQLRLCGRRTAGKPDEITCEGGARKAWAFAGIHVLSPAIFGLMSQGGATQAELSSKTGARSGEATAVAQSRAFSIIPEYLRLAAAGEKIMGFPADGAYWRDLGTPASLQQAAEDIARGLIAP